MGVARTRGENGTISETELRGNSAGQAGSDAPGDADGLEGCCSAAGAEGRDALCRVSRIGWSTWLGEGVGGEMSRCGVSVDATATGLQTEAGLRAARKRRGPLGEETTNETVALNRLEEGEGEVEGETRPASSGCKGDRPTKPSTGRTDVRMGRLGRGRKCESGSGQQGRWEQWYVTLQYCTVLCCAVLYGPEAHAGGRRRDRPGLSRHKGGAAARPSWR